MAARGTVACGVLLTSKRTAPRQCRQSTIICWLRNKLLCSEIITVVSPHYSTNLAMEVALSEVHDFMVRSLVSVGTPEELARDHADLLLHADVTGHFSHGLNRLEFYINDIKGGGTFPAARSKILKETAATAWVDGGDGLGATIGNFCMELACKKARECGVGWVSAKRCNHFGMAGWWAQKAERQGLIGMAFTNSSPIMVPTRAKDRALGTNPIALAAPATSPEDSLVADMAATTVAMGKIEVKIHNDEPLPSGWALGPDNKPTTDAQLAFDTGKLLPLGGFEETSGYKGFALSALVEMFCSGLSGSNSSHHVPGWTFDSTEGPSNLGQCYVAIDPDCFAPGFRERVAECVNYWRGLEPLDPSLPVLAPGDKERINAEETKRRGTITYPQRQIDSCNAMAKKYNIRPLKTL